MPSVIASWNGRLTNRATRQQLCTHLLRLGELSHGYFETPEPVRQYDRAIEGNILVSSSLFGKETADRLVCLHEAPTSSLAGIRILPAGPYQAPKTVSDDLYAIEHAVIHGVDFRLYDGRGLYPGEDHISFVFLESESCPELSGAIVQVEDHRQCGVYRDELIQGADWFIQRPQIHLRGYCEDWFDMLMSWVKYFYVPSLEFWRHETFPNWETLLGIYEQYQAGYGDMEQYSSTAFEYIADSFSKVVEEWRESSAQVRNFWANAASIENRQDPRK